MATEPRLLLDVTRSLRRLRHAYPSGIDRVERAYIHWAMDRDAVFFAMLGSTCHILGKSGAQALLELLDGDEHPLDLSAYLRPDRNRRLRMGEALVRRHSIGRGARSIGQCGAHVYLNTGHMNLTASIIDSLAPMTRVALIHDLIPLEYPKFARLNGPGLMLQRLKAACRADHIVANSVDTAERIVVASTQHGLSPPPITPIPLGIIPPTQSVARETLSHFVCLGTIEPRKNHALLLDIWQPDWPDLYIVGRRGWENRAVFQRLDRPAPNILERNDLGDGEINRLVSTARALLFPSFAEGFGLPLAEALALGTPVIASDLAALREVGGEIPDYLAPTDHSAWTRQILSYIAGGDEWSSQVARLPHWSPPLWSSHFSKIEELLEELGHNKIR